jgi:hypothetical protein
MHTVDYARHVQHFPYSSIAIGRGHTEYDIKEKIKEFIKSPTTKRVTIFVFSCLVNYTICPGIGTVIKFVFTNGDGVEASIGEDSFAFVFIGFCLRSWLKHSSRHAIFRP